MTEQNFEGMEEVKSQFVKWGMVGDWIKGTLVDVREVPSQMPGKEGAMQKIYEFKTNSGSFHDLDENKQPIPEAVTLEKGSVWSIGGKAGIDSQMRNVKIGQIFGMRFVEEKPSKTKGYNAQKVVKVYAGGMDPEFQGEMPGDEIPG